MTRRHLSKHVAAVVLWLIFYGVIYGVLGSPSLLKDLLPLALALPTAALAAAFNRRSSYMQALRELWKTLLPTVQHAIQYTFATAPSQADYGRVMTELSVAIDSTRGVFANIPGPKSGLYPFENLKDIQNAISWLGFGESFRPIADRNRARACIVALWQEMYAALLAEFDRDVPVRPVSKYLYASGTSVVDLLKARALIPATDLRKGTPASHPVEPYERSRVPRRFRFVWPRGAA